MSNPAAATPVIVLEGVERCYSGVGEVMALDGVSMEAGAGEFVCVLGPSGSGKSTLLNVLGLLDTPTGGRYSLAGLDTSSLTRAQKARLRCEQIGFVFQAFHLVAHLTALENVELPFAYKKSPTNTRTIAREALERVGMSHRQDFFPAMLSGGEQQRVAIARALVGRPALILCDEPTGNLDGENSDRVIRLLSDLVAEGNTVVVVTHDTGVADHAHRRLMMNNGRFLEHTTT